MNTEAKRQRGYREHQRRSRERDDKESARGHAEAARGHAKATKSCAVPKRASVGDAESQRANASQAKVTLG